MRAGQTEATVDLARLAGLAPAGVICEIMNEDGTMARVPQLVEFCERHGLKMISVADLIRYRLKHEHFVQRGRRAASRPPSAISAPSPTRSDLIPRATWRWCAAKCAARKTCWCACTRAASTAMSSVPASASVRSLVRELAARDRRGRDRAFWFTCTRPDPGFRIERDAAARHG